MSRPGQLGPRGTCQLGPAAPPRQRPSPMLISLAARLGGRPRREPPTFPARSPLASHCCCEAPRPLPEPSPLPAPLPGAVQPTPPPPLPRPPARRPPSRGESQGHSGVWLAREPRPRPRVLGQDPPTDPRFPIRPVRTRATGQAWCRTGPASSRKPPGTLPPPLLSPAPKVFGSNPRAGGEPLQALSSESGSSAVSLGLSRERAGRGSQTFGVYRLVEFKKKYCRRTEDC